GAGLILCINGINHRSRERVEWAEKRKPKKV
ncbi:MAG: hypothetical protein ACI8X3_003570, partial [Saprospiraceae bacterium]